MNWLFRSVTDRLKALFVSDVASEFETQLITRDAERRAELLRQAQRYESEGLKGIAQHLRQRANSIDIERPMATVLPAIEHLQQQPDSPKRLSEVNNHQSTQRLLPNKRKGR